MTLDEAKAIGRIASTADSGCSTCVQSLTEMLGKYFPQFVWTYPGKKWEEVENWEGELFSTWWTGIDVEPAAPTDVSGE